MKFEMRTLLLAGLTIGTLAACNNDGSKNNQSVDSLGQTTEAPEKSIKIVPVEQSPEFPDAQLTIKKVSTEMLGTDSVKVTIDYDVKNYELKKQTEGEVAGACNNSKDGQHIHFILDNKPYTALYKPTHTFTLPINSEHYVMSFLSRSYHESLKNKDAGVLLHFKVDEKGKYHELANPNTPMIFYSRPKGDYVGKDTENVLLDFYVYNTNLAADGNKVKATINGNSFVIDKWIPYFIHNAPMGSMKVKLEILDKDGKNIGGENTTIDREVTLAPSEPVR
jgi:hypothetical protein